jgi:hypothetical protein
MSGLALAVNFLPNSPFLLFFFSHFRGVDFCEKGIFERNCYILSSETIGICIGMENISSQILDHPRAVKQYPTGLYLMRSWLGSDGMFKPSVTAARPAAREAKSLLSNWVVPEISSDKSINISDRTRQSAGKRSFEHLMSEWMFSTRKAHVAYQAGPQVSNATILRLLPVASIANVSNIRNVDGNARVPSCIRDQQSAARRSAWRGSLAVSWLTTGVQSKLGVSAIKLALPIATIVALAGASCHAKQMVVARNKIAGQLVRRSSVEATSRLALKFT